VVSEIQNKLAGLANAEDFLLAHYRRMPRTMLRYAIEHFDEEKRLGYLKGTI